MVMEVVETALEELAMAEVDWMAEGWETEPGKAVALASDDSAAVVAVTAAADLVSVVQAMAVEMVREKAEVMVAVEIVVVVMALVGVATARGGGRNGGGDGSGGEGGGGEGGGGEGAGGEGGGGDGGGGDGFGRDGPGGRDGGGNGGGEGGQVNGGGKRGGCDVGGDGGADKVEAPSEVGMVVRTAAWVAAVLAVWEMAAAVKAS